MTPIDNCKNVDKWLSQNNPWEALIGCLDFVGLTSPTMLMFFDNLF